MSTAPSFTDRRFERILHTNTVYDPAMPSYASLEEWERRRDALKTHIRVASGIFPEPDKCDLNVRVTGETAVEGARIQNVAFESYPGFFVTGNLYLPESLDGPVPGIACPHGHAAHGRFEDTENFSVPARCVTLARHDNVVFTYDMIGYNDSLQFPHDYATDRAYLWGVSLLGLQLWNSVRALDYLESLDEVDSERLACVGASGGGTQTFLLTAIDERVKVASPNVMVSAHMQGGCLCENAPHLRLATNNVEIAAMTAPRPLLLVSATGDWTKDTPTIEYPAIREIYKLYNAEDRIHEVQIDAGHNFNQPSRQAVYEWMGRWLHGDDDPDRWTEPPYELPPVESRRVFPDGLPEGASDGPAVLNTIIAAHDAQISDLHATEPGGSALRELYEHTLNVEWPDSVDAVESGGQLVLSREGMEDAIPAALHMPARHPKSIVVVATTDGRDGFDPSPLVEAGHGVLLFDAFGTGSKAGQSREEARHFLTFNHTDIAHRVQDTLTACAYARTVSTKAHLVGDGEGGVWVTLALPYISEIDRVIFDISGFDRSDAGFESGCNIPALRRAGDFVTAALLRTPRSMRAHGATDPAPYAVVAGTYAAAGAIDALSASPEPMTTDDILSYLR